MAEPTICFVCGKEKSPFAPFEGMVGCHHCPQPGLEPEPEMAEKDGG